MGFLFALLMIGTMLVCAVGYVIDRDTRGQANRTLLASPIGFINAAIGPILCAGFFLGVFIRPFGSIQIGFEDLTAPLWAVCGVAGFLWALVFISRSRGR
jgi:hypothetical protein